MVNRRWNSKRAHCFLALITLAFPLTVARGGAPQTLSSEDTELRFPKLLPRSPFSPRLSAPPGEEGKRGKGETPATQQTAIVDRQSTIDNGYDAPGAIANRYDAPQADTDTIQDAEFAFPSLLPRSPFPILGGKEKRRKGETATALRIPVSPSPIPRSVGSPLSPEGERGVISTISGGRQAPWATARQGAIDNRQPAIESPPGLLLPPPLLRLGITQRQTARAETAAAWRTPIDNQQPTIVNPHDRPGTTDQLAAVAVSCIEVWEKASLAIAALKAELAFPSLLPQPPLTPTLWAYDIGPLPGQAKTQTADSTQVGNLKLMEPETVLGPAVFATAFDPPSAAQGLGPQSTAGGIPELKEDAPTRSEASTAKPRVSQRDSTVDSVAPLTSEAVQPPEQSADLHVGRGLRDPFKLPAPTRSSSGEDDRASNVSRPPGARGLLVPQVRLKGVVEDNVTHKMIAVVTDSSNRAYFLREGEAVYNAVVSKITPDAVYFKENALDPNRQVHSREVVKTLNPAAGEVR